MNATDNFILKINDRYSLCPLRTVDKDDLTPIFTQGKGVYICSFPHPEWYRSHKFKQTKNYSIEKKENFFNLMEDGSILLSPTQDSRIKKPTKTYTYRENIIHFGSSFTGRLAQIVMALKIMFWLFNNRNSYQYCLIYNFYPAEMLCALFAKYVLGKKTVVDFEDDYLSRSKKRLYDFYFSLVKKIPDIVICINRDMERYFADKKIYIFNGFIDLSYIKNDDFELFEGMKILYAGALDRIRGVDLIPEIVKALEVKIDNFKIYITGSGPLEREVKNFGIDNVQYLGFLPSDEYKRILNEVDVCLVLQKPDHPFSQGSYPSKIEYYANFKKPIYKVDKIDD